MSEHRVALPDLFFLAVTRGMIGFGAGLLLAERFSREPRRIVGLSLFAFGALSTIPIAIRLFRRREDRTDNQPLRGMKPRAHETAETVAH